MANEEFNNIIEDMLNGYVQGGQFTTPTSDGRSYFDNNYSGFNTKPQNPSVHPSLLKYI
jgi:hypothetical protein